MKEDIEMDNNSKLRIVSDCYTLYDLKIIDYEQFSGIINLLLSVDPENHVMAELVVKSFVKNKKYRYYRKLNKRLPFARSAKEEKMGVYDNVCPKCDLQHKDVRDNHLYGTDPVPYCPNVKCGNNPAINFKNSLELNYNYSYDRLWLLLHTNPEQELKVATVRSIQRRLEIKRLNKYKYD